MVVIKHDGRKEAFDHTKVYNAVAKAAEEVGVDVPRIEIQLDGDEVDVDTIHDKVEQELMKYAPAVAKAYILYREKRTEIREGKSKLMGTVSKLIEEMNHDNANTGNSAASKMYGIAEATSKQYYLGHMSPKWAENHKKGRTYFHDLSYRNITFNCFFNPIGKMLENGFDNGVGWIRSPKRIGSAMALVAIILQSSQNSLFGGQGILNFDTDLAPYVTKEYEWQYKYLTENLNELSPEEAKNMAAVTRKAWELTDRAVYQAMEAFVYNMNTMRSRSGAQVTFSSVNFGLDRTTEGKMISKNLFKAYMAGLGNGENPIFPNLCYRLMDGVNLHPDEPNFDLTELAIECMGKRIQPRFVFCDSPAYPNKWEAGTMGCVDGAEIITYQYHGETYCESFERMYNRLVEDVQASGASEYIVPDCLKIYDGKNGFVNVKTAIKNPDMGNWVRITFEGGRSILVTSDHPLYTENKGRILVSSLNIGDTIKTYYDMPTLPQEEWVTTDAAYALGLILVDGNYDRNVTVTLDTKTEQDIISAFMNRAELGLNHKCSITEYDRGVKGEYTMVRVLEHQKEICKYLTELFGGRNKVCRNIPREVFVASREVKLAFLAGMIDGDGHINHKSNVQLGSINKELSLQQVALLQSLGIPTKMYLNHYDSKDINKIRYRVEFAMSDDIAKYMASEKKKCKQWNGITPKIRTPDIIKVTKIEVMGYLNKPSYDVETETDTFTLSFIRSGNCRTAVRDNVNGSSTPDARGNLAFTTLNLPYFALEAKRNLGSNTDKATLLQEFYRIYDEAIQDAIDELHDRYNVIKNLKVKDVPFVSDWYQGHEGLKPDDTIEPMVKNGSLSVGFIGLAEALIVLIGKHHGESMEAQSLGLEIIRRLRNRMDKEKNDSSLNWSCFASPCESACYTLLKAIRKEFGVIKGVSDKDYLTNSCHLPVGFNCDMKQKIDIEAPYHLLCNAGAIFYIEAPSSPKFNHKGCLRLLQYMAKSGIVYGGLNYEHDFCVDCGEQGTFTVCPRCGSKHIRVTKIITGYLSTTDRFNAGKQAEAKDRVSHA